MKILLNWLICSSAIDTSVMPPTAVSTAGYSREATGEMMQCLCDAEISIEKLRSALGRFADPNCYNLQFSRRGTLFTCLSSDRYLVPCRARYYPLYIALDRNNAQAVCLLLEFKADPLIQYSFTTGSTKELPIETAIKRNVNVDVIRSLLAVKTSEQLSVRDSEDSSVLALLSNRPKLKTEITKVLQSTIEQFVITIQNKLSVSSIFKNCPCVILFIIVLYSGVENVPQEAYDLLKKQ